MSDEHKRLWFQAYCAALQGQLGASEFVSSKPRQLRELSVSFADTAMAEFYVKFGADAPTSNAYEGWAHLEVMGHRSHYGRVREIRAYGAKLIEIQCLNAEGGLSEERYQYGGGAIFCNTPMDEKTCRHSARGEHEVGCSHVDETTHERCGIPVWTTDYRGFCPLHHEVDDEHPEEEGDDGLPW